MVMDCELPGESWPLLGLKLTPLKELLVVQLALPCEPAVSARVSEQV